MVNGDENSTAIIEGLLSDLKMLKRFSPEQLRNFTSKFDTRLGTGTFGNVFKGVLHDGVQVAVKVLKETVLDAVNNQFKAEVLSLSNINHKHVVKLYGFCFEQGMKALVYEFMENESLDKRLYEKQSIAWEKLCNIAVGTAKGLAYLHEDCQPRILHYDVKPANIFLDSKFSPKVGDFGLAKLLCQDMTHITEYGFRGTSNYGAPELLVGPSLATHKCDVFSFGISLFDIIGRRKHVPGEGENWFPVQVWKKFKEKKQEEIMQKCGIHENNRKQAKRFLLIALWCVQFQPDERPSMSHVVRLLEGREEIPMLSNPFWHLSSPSTTHNKNSVEDEILYISSSSAVTEEDEEDNISSTTLGPWGGLGGSRWDDGIFTGIKKIKVFKGIKGEVRGIQVLYYGKFGESISTRRHGRKEAHTIHTIKLDYPSEYLIRVTGFSGYELGNLGLFLVRSLCFFTNKKIYGPIGDERGTYFTSENDGKDGKIVGFHGRDGLYLDAIGMHMEYNKDHREKLKENDAVNVTRIKPTTVGPWGGPGGGNWDDGVSPGIIKIEIYKGIKGDVRSMQIVYCGKDGNPIWTERHGFKDPHTTDIINLDYPKEYLVKVTGFHGYESGDGRFDQVRSLCFVSNMKKYGPFGNETGTCFSTEKDGKDGKIIGFHGRAGYYLDAIGVHMEYSP